LASVRVALGVVCHTLKINCDFFIWASEGLEFIPSTEKAEKSYFLTKHNSRVPKFSLSVLVTNSSVLG